MNKRLVIIEFLVIIIIVILSIYFKFYPEYKKTRGSSASFLDIGNYQDMVELTINSSPNFALVTNTTNEISNIFFFDNDSLCLYNKDIENKKVAVAIKEIIKVLIQNDYLKQNDTITITEYGNISYQEIKKSLQDELNRLQINITLIEAHSTITDKGKALEIVGEEEVTILRQLSVYSQDIVRQNKNNVSKKDNQFTNKQKNLTEEKANQYATNVYQKIEKYVKENNVVTQEKNDMVLPITLIPADSTGNYYPSDKSWYYVENGRIYAYINLESVTNTYSYCYQGAADAYKKGEC